MDTNGVEPRDLYLSQKDYGMWIQIQQNTFTNWVNECLNGRGIVLADLRTELSNGVKLVALVEALCGHSIQGAVLRPSNHYQQLENITIALDAIRLDGVKIVNIDSSDIFECNLKLILALIWQLILKYQVGSSGSLNKSWILKWIQGAVSDCSLSNLTTDLNDGIVLHALLEFCKPGLSPRWREMDRDTRVENCRSAMKLARQHFNVPLILRPEDMASPDLDELSAITYLSYFIKIGGPGYFASLNQISNRIKPLAISNFTTDWQDGQAIVHLVRSAGGRVDDGQDTKLDVVKGALESGQQLGVAPLLKPEDFVSESVEHLGIMAYAVQFLKFPNYIYTNNTSNGHDNSGTIRDETVSALIDEHKSVSQNNINLASIHVNTERHSMFRNYRHSKNSYYSSKNSSIKVTDFRDDASTLTSTITTTPAMESHQLATFDLVNKSTDQTPKVEVPAVDDLKVDVYSTGVIMEGRIRGEFDPEKLLVEGTSPSGRYIKMSGDGQYASQFGPDEIGRWNVSMSYDNKVLEKSPVDVCDPSQVKVTDLRGGYSGRGNQFTVDCSKAGPGDLGVDVTSNGHFIPSRVTKTALPGVYSVRFTPYIRGPHEVNVHFNRAEVRDSDFYTFNQEDRKRKALFNTELTPQQGYVDIKATCDWEIDYITGSPFVCHVSDRMDIPVYRMKDGTVCGSPELIVDCTQVGQGRVDAEVTYQGLRFPCKVREERDRPNVHRIRFKPRGPGIYKVWINMDSTPIKGSPFVQEIAELEGPSVYGDGLYRGVLGKPVSFNINTKGFPGEVAVGIEGPSMPVQPKLDVQDGHVIVATYQPEERGLYHIHISLDGKTLKGSPYHPLIVDPFKVRVTGGLKTLLGGSGVIPLKVRKEKILPFDVSEAGPGELTADVQGPHGKIPVTIDAKKDGQHSVVFIPRDVGKHYIHVNWGGYPLANSPYLGEATVNEDDDGDDDFPNVHLVPIRLQSPTSPTPGSVSSLTSPTLYRIQDQPDGGHRPQEFTTYRPVEPTTIQIISPEPRRDPRSYQPIKLYQYDHHRRPVSPLAPISPQYSPTYSPPSHTKSINAPQKVVLSGKGLKEAVVRSPAYFQVDGTKATPGEPSAHLESVHYRLPVSHQLVRPNVYRCHYVPVKSGAYLLYINWNGKALRGSPFKINIRDPVDPEKVNIRLDPKGGWVGMDYEMKADISEAGIGQLTATCTDPVERNVPVRLSENFDGTCSLRVKPVMAGKHLVEVRYNGQHVRGSPFIIDIKENTATGTVKVWGPGIESGVIPRFQSTFWVETTGAGSGDLRVRIIGPKGAFNVKMRKASEKDKIYQCFYDPVEPGVYTVHIQWSGVHVNGSPYTILLGDTELDLARMQDELQTTGIASSANDSLRRNTSAGINFNNSYNNINSLRRNTTVSNNHSNYSNSLIRKNNKDDGDGDSKGRRSTASTSNRGSKLDLREGSMVHTKKGERSFSKSDGVGDMLY